MLAVLGIVKKGLDMATGIISSREAAVRGKSGIIAAEVNGNSLQRNWRPFMMWMFLFIVANNHVIFPYVVWMGGSIPILPVPSEMWSLMMIGMGGYITGRSIEKVVLRGVADKEARKQRKADDEKDNNSKKKTKVKKNRNSK